MKPNDQVIKFEQLWIEQKRRKQQRQERIDAIKFATALLIIGIGTLWLTLTIMARVM